MNLLEELTREEIPPPPVNMQRGVHDRLNHWLATSQLIELVVHAFAYATYHFAFAVAGAVIFSVTGKFPETRDAKESPGNGTSEE